MKFEKLILLIILLPLILFFVLVLLPLILIYAVIMLLLHKPAHVQFGRSFVFARQEPQQDQESDDSVIDVEVIKSEDSGVEHDISGRTLRP